MGSPLIFFIIIIAIDLILKSSRDKEKIQKERAKKMETMDKPYTKPKNLMNVLRDEFEKEMERNKPTIKPVEQESYMDSLESTVGDDFKGSILSDSELVYKEPKKVSQPESNIKLDLKKDMVKAIIYSEILSPPKSIQNQKRSM